MDHLDASRTVRRGTVFQGVSHQGLIRITLRWYGAVIFSSAAWALIHLQYDVYGVIVIFLLGLILGTARVKSDSTLLTMFLHSFVNLCATGEVIVHLRGVLSYSL